MGFVYTKPAVPGAGNRVDSAKQVVVQTDYVKLSFNTMRNAQMAVDVDAAVDVEESNSPGEDVWVTFRGNYDVAVTDSMSPPNW